ncbi:MAG: HflC protein [Gammaproteobacteria bacterium RBG_16_51_14]|nr:MAG: HflC protein [Gammaproteobacteria bacterium RBG_16_51_14]
MLNPRFTIPLILVVLVGLFSLFHIKQWEQAIVFQFREIAHTDSQPGLHVMIPVMYTVQKFEKRLLNLDQEARRFLTKEKKDVLVDYYVKWLIIDVEKFYTSTRGDFLYANGLIEQRISRALRDQFGERTVQEVVAGERTEILDTVKRTTSKLIQELGISVVDVRTKRIDLPEEVSQSVYNRMRAERDRVAKDFRARGSEASERIKANADRESEVILANAYRDAEIIKGEGDAQATEIYAAAFSKDEEFYALYRSLNAYQNSFKGGNDILLLKPDSDFFRYFNHPGGK